MKWVLDTTAFSALMKKDPDALTLVQNYPPRHIVTVPPVVAEIQFGIKRLDSSTRKSLLLSTQRDRLLSVIAVLPRLHESSDYFGKIKANLERRGELIDDFDIAIAAIALSHHCGVMTANLRHFQRIKSLECANW